MRFEFTNEEFNILKKAVANTNEEKNIKKAKECENGKIMDLTEEEAIALRDACADYLLLNGFDENYNVTHEGEILEKLIDKLFTG